MLQDAANTVENASESEGQGAGQVTGQGDGQGDGQGADIQIGGDEPLILKGQSFTETMDHIWHYRLFSVNNNTVQVSNLVIALIVLVLGYGMARWFSGFVGRRWLPRLRLQAAAIHTIQSLLFYLLLTIVVLSSLDVAGVPLTALAFLGGAIAIGIGFGSQNVINNFISGLILLIERPIRVGEMVTVQDQTGTIISIGARATQIHSYMGATYFVPNSMILESSVTNWHRPERRIKSIVGVGVAYGSDTGKVRELLDRAMSEQKLVNKSNDNRVMFVEFGDSSLNFEIHCWINPRNALERKSYESDLRYRIDELFREHGIEIPFPQRDMNFRSDKPLHVRMSRDEGSGEQ